jgi:hypothetical protein
MDVVSFSHMVNECTRLKNIPQQLRQTKAKIRALERKITREMKRCKIRFIDALGTLWRVGGEWQRGCTCRLCEQST